MRSLLRVPSEAMMSLMSGALKMRGLDLEAKSHGATLDPCRTGRQVWSRRTCGDIRALPCQVTSPTTWGTWRRWSPFASGGGRVWSRGIRGNTGALPYQVAGPVTRGDARALPHREVGLKPQDT
jgi:hypothetical protein